MRRHTKMLCLLAYKYSSIIYILHPFIMTIIMNEYFVRRWGQSFQKTVGVNRTIFSGSKVIFPTVTHLYYSRSKKDHFYRDDETGTYENKSVTYNDMICIFVNKQVNKIVNKFYEICL